MRGPDLLAALIGACERGFAAAKPWLVGYTRPIEAQHLHHAPRELLCPLWFLVLISWLCDSAKTPKLTSVSVA